MEREGFNVMVVSLVVAIGLSLYVGQLQAAVTLPPDAKFLKRHFYKKLNTCENVEAFVKHQVEYYWKKDKSITAKLLKLLYADCMVNGCDASILLEGPHTEKKSPKNSWLGEYGFFVIGKIKTVLEERCPRAVSCSDILNLAVRDAVHLGGAPSYPVLLGRRDGVESNAAWVDLPLPSISLEQGFAYFRSKGLDQQDYATLLGGHTLGKAHCASINDRLSNYNNTKRSDPSMSKSTLDRLRSECAKKENTVYLTEKSGGGYKFTNAYYANVLSHDAVLAADQQLLYNYNTTQLALEYAGKFEHFRRQFALSISRMGSLRVLTGQRGEIRQNCSFVNKHNPHLR